MFCKKCGSPMPDGSDFCPRCGTAQRPPSQNSGGKPALNLKKWLPFALVALLVLLFLLDHFFFSGSSAPDAGSRQPSSSPAVSALQTTPAPTPEPTPEPPQDDFVDVQPLSDFSDGLAFARVSLPDGSEKCVYINLQGEIAIELPEGYNYGFPFHEGYAAVSNLQDKLEQDGADEIDDGHLSAAGYSRYNLIDTQGNLLFNGEDYCYIGPVGEGKVLTRTVKNDYNGSSQVVAFRDLEENILWEVDVESIYNRLSTSDSFAGDDNYLRAPWCSAYRNGITTLYGRGSFGGYLYCYDAQGNLVEQFKPGTYTSGAPENVSVEGFDSYLTSDLNERGRSMWVIYHRNDNTVVPLEYLPFPESVVSESVWPDGYGLPSDLRYFLEGRNIGIGGSQAFFIYDSSGTILMDKAEPAVRRIVSGMDGHWVAELQNGYYGLLDLNGDLSMEPVLGEIVPMGSGLYLCTLSGEVIDAQGELRFTLPEEYTTLNRPIQPDEYYPSDGRFHEGVAVLGSIYSNRPCAYVDLRGELLRTSTDFREYAKWLAENQPSAENAA